MPNRHIYLLLITIIICSFCYFRTDRYVSSFSYLMHMVQAQALEPRYKRELFDGALDGMLSTLDENSSYIPPVFYEEFDESLRQEFGGIGVSCLPDEDTGRPVISFTLPDSPAAKAGLKAGDQITAIDDQMVDGLGFDQVNARLRGPVGTSVAVDVFRPSDTRQHRLSIQRNRIRTETVEGILRNGDGTWRYFLPPLLQDAEAGDEEAGTRTATDAFASTGIAYLRITSFGEYTPVEVLRHLKSLQSRKMKGLIIDLRDNSGGLLESGIKVCNFFVREGVIVSTRGRDGMELRTVIADATQVLNKKFPIAILINEHSASASEIVAACLQDHARNGELNVVCIGTRSFGKGTVQQLVELGPLPNDHRFDMLSGERAETSANSPKPSPGVRDILKQMWTEKPPRAAIRITVASYWRPSGKNIHRFEDATPADDWGVSPDQGMEVDVPRTENGRISAAFMRTFTRYMSDRLHGKLSAEDWLAIYEFDPQLKKAMQWEIKQTEK